MARNIIEEALCKHEVLYKLDPHYKKACDEIHKLPIFVWTPDSRET